MTPGSLRPPGWASASHVVGEPKKSSREFKNVAAKAVRRRKRLADDRLGVVELMRRCHARVNQRSCPFDRTVKTECCRGSWLLAWALA